MTQIESTVPTHTDTEKTSCSGIESVVIGKRCDVSHVRDLLIESRMSTSRYCPKNAESMLRRNVRRVIYAVGLRMSGVGAQFQCRPLNQLVPRRDVARSSVYARRSILFSGSGIGIPFSVLTHKDGAGSTSVTTLVSITRIMPYKPITAMPTATCAPGGLYDVSYPKFQKSSIAGGASMSRTIAY